MSSQCCDSPPTGGGANYRRVLWVVLGINAAMFLVEILAGLAAGSVALQADALDFLGDTASYGISLFVLGMTLRYRAAAALAKGAAMGLFGVWVLTMTVWHVVNGTVPDATTMGVVGTAALVANVVVFGLLWTHRRGDSNMRSVWVCSRNDVVANFAVLLAALGVFGTRAGWPDAVVGGVMSVLALHGAWVVLPHAATEWRDAVVVPSER